MPTGHEFRFVCSNCGHELEADESVQRAVNEHGCVVCGVRPAEAGPATATTGRESAG